VYSYIDDEQRPNIRGKCINIRTYLVEAFSIFYIKTLSSRLSSKA